MRKLYGHMVRILHWCTDQSMTQALTEMDLTAAQGHIIGHLVRRKEPPCARDIEEAFCLRHPTVSGLLSRLEKKNFIEIRPDAQDRRTKRIYILPKGIECNQRILETIHENETRMVLGFTELEKEQFAAYLERAIANMGGGHECYRIKEDEKK